MDNDRKEIVALKIEKAGKSKKVLQLEYQILKNLQGIIKIIKGLPNICPVYDYIENSQMDSSNFIVMKMLGKNLATLKKYKGKKFTSIFAIKLLVSLD